MKRARQLSQAREACGRFSVRTCFAWHGARELHSHFDGVQRAREQLCASQAQR
jgi:hypothetical protein